MRSAGLKVLIAAMAFALFAGVIACGGADDEADPTPEPAPTVDPAELARVVQEAVREASPQQVSGGRDQPDGAGRDPSGSAPRRLGGRDQPDGAGPQ